MSVLLAVRSDEGWLGGGAGMAVDVRFALQ